MAADVRAHLKTTAEGYLFLKGKAGATLIQMKAAKLFKGTLNRCKTLALGVDLADVLENLMDEGKVRAALLFFLYLQQHKSCTRMSKP